MRGWGWFFVQVNKRLQKEKENQAQSNGALKALVPLHVVAAIKQKPIFDFLANFGLGAERNV